MHDSNDLAWLFYIFKVKILPSMPLTKSGHNGHSGLILAFSQHKKVDESGKAARAVVIDFSQY